MWEKKLSKNKFLNNYKFFESSFLKQIFRKIVFTFWFIFPPILNILHHTDFLFSRHFTNFTEFSSIVSGGFFVMLCPTQISAKMKIRKCYLEIVFTFCIHPDSAWGIWALRRGLEGNRNHLRRWNTRSGRCPGAGTASTPLGQLTVSFSRIFRLCNPCKLNSRMLNKKNAFLKLEF